jgi:hypothetical protein
MTRRKTTRSPTYPGITVLNISFLDGPERAGIIHLTGIILTEILMIFAPSVAATTMGRAPQATTNVPVPRKGISARSFAGALLRIAPTNSQDATAVYVASLAT